MTLKELYFANLMWYPEDDLYLQIVGKKPDIDTVENRVREYGDKEVMFFKGYTVCLREDYGKGE